MHIERFYRGFTIVVDTAPAEIDQLRGRPVVVPTYTASVTLRSDHENGPPMLPYSMGAGTYFVSEQAALAAGVLRGEKLVNEFLSKQLR